MVLGDCDLSWKEWQHRDKQGEVAFQREGMVRTQLWRQACSPHTRDEGINVLGEIQVGNLSLVSACRR